MKNEREERKGTIMDHMTFMTIFSLLATLGMVLVIMLGMSAFQPPLAEVGKKRVRSIRRKIPSGEEVPNDVPTLRWIDGA